MIYQVIWFVLMVVLITVYAVLDGFDLGVGFWQIFAGKDERKHMFGIIKPYWDGNEVWLLAGGGSLFAAFPFAYATIFSGFYPAAMLIIFSLILRATSNEFREHTSNPKTAAAWDFVFFLSSSLPCFLFGVALANLSKGIPLDLNGDYTGTFFGLLNPYSIIFGIMSFVMFILHGATYTAFKSDGAYRDSAIKRAKKTWWFYMIMFFVVTVFSVGIYPHISINYWVRPVLLFLPFFALISIISIRIFLGWGKSAAAFISSSVSIVLLFATYAAGLFPYLVYSIGGDGLPLKIYNSSSSEKTLFTMLIIALIGLPFVFGYFVYLYRVFEKGKG